MARKDSNANRIVGTVAVVASVLGGLSFGVKSLSPESVPQSLETKVIQTSEKPKKTKLSGKFEYLNVYNDLIEENVSEFNKKHGRNLDSDLVRAVMITESGSPLHRDNAFKYDPLQIANPGSYAIKVLGNGREHTTLIGDFDNLKGKRKTPRDKEGELDYSNSNMTAEDSIEGGVGWLFHKAAIYNERVVEKGNVINYKVKSGDSFWKIARKNGSTIETLRKYNPDIIPEKMQVGAKINFRKAKREIYISGWRDWKKAVDRYGDSTQNYKNKVSNAYKQIKESRRKK